MNTIPKSAQFGDWLCRLDLTLYEATSFDSSTPFIYMVKEGEVHKDHVKIR